MKARVKKRQDVGSCSYCERGTLTSDGKGLDYPYNEVIEISGSRVVSRLCFGCLKKLMALENTIKHEENRMKKLKHDLLINKYTNVYHEEDFSFNAPHYFEVYESGEDSVPAKELARIHFQEGAIKEHGINGVMNEDLIAMVICRLEHFNQSEFGCRENAMAITKLEESLLWLRKRTMGRENRGVEGTHQA